MPNYRDGDIINGYAVVSCIREGNYATAYKVRKGARHFFLKEYADPTSVCPEYKGFVVHQKALDERLKNSGMRCVEETVDTFEANYRYHQVKPLYECTDLAAYLKTNYDLDDRLFICRNWLGVLREVHRLRIVHQDLKPEQILMVKDAAAGKLGYLLMFADFDWGIIDGKALKIVSTPGYTTPEHMTLLQPTPESDIYQTGIVFYQLLTDTLPFYRAGEIYDSAVTLQRMQRNEFEPPHKIQPVVPEHISSVIGRMLQWDATKRSKIDDIIDDWRSGPEDAGWIRLRHASGCAMTFSSAETAVTRLLFHGAFRAVTTPSGSPVAAYFPSDDKTPLFTIRKTPAGWILEGGAHRNHVLLNGVRAEGRMLLANGATMQLYSEKEKSAVADFIFEFG